MGCVIRKPAFRICENEGAGQLHMKIPLFPYSEISSLSLSFYYYTARFVSDLLGNNEDRFSHDAVYVLHNFFKIQDIRKPY